MCYCHCNIYDIYDEGSKYSDNSTIINDDFSLDCRVSQVMSGIRELSEGVLKYEGDMVEFVDRLLFITASSTVFSDYPTIQRFGNNVLKPFAGLEDLQYEMAVTPDIAQYLRGASRTTKTRTRGRDNPAMIG